MTAATATKPLYAVRGVAYRPVGYYDAMTHVHDRPGGQWEPGDEIRPGTVPDWLIATWTAQGAVSTDRPDVEPVAPACDITTHQADPHDPLARAAWAARSGTQDPLRLVARAVERVDQVAADEATLRVTAALAAAGDRATVREALEQAGMDADRIAAVLPKIRSADAQARTERERLAWRDALRRV